MFVQRFFVRQIKKSKRLICRLKIEIQKGIIPNPAEVDPITGEPLPQEGGGELGDVPQDEDLDAESQITDAEYQKDTKTAEI